MQDLADYFRSLPQTHKETKRWSIKDGIIYDSGEPLDLARFKRELKVISLYFREWQKFGNLEAQVLVVTKEDYEKYYTQFAILPVESNLRLIILPQFNTPANTIIQEEYWHKTIKGEPVMRVHSHHVLNAYQSSTDYESLNSGTLEVVLGKVHEDVNEVAYWLTRHSDISAKNYVHQTKLNLQAQDAEKEVLND